MKPIAEKITFGKNSSKYAIANILGLEIGQKNGSVKLLLLKNETSDRDKCINDETSCSDGDELDSTIFKHSFKRRRNALANIFEF